MTIARDWTICADCKAISEPTYPCDLCGEEFCRDCRADHTATFHSVLKCPGCDVAMEALWECDECDVPYCRDCLTRCDGPCNRMLCPDDHKLGVCEEERHSLVRGEP